MLRTRQTADILFPKMHYTVVDGLIETDFGRFEGKSADKLSGDPAYQAWVDAMCLTPIPEGESVTDFKTRCCEAFAETIKMCRTALTWDSSSTAASSWRSWSLCASEEGLLCLPHRKRRMLQGVYDGETIQIK